MKVNTFISIALVAAATSVADAQVRHVPPADIESGHVLELVATAPAQTPRLVAQVRTVGTTQWTPIELVRREGDDWVAVVPPALIVEPGVEYYVLAGDEPVFASPQWPHSLAVTVPAEEQRRARDTARTHGRRSRIHALGEWVNYGSTANPGPGRPGWKGQFYRFEADFSYRLWTYPLEEIRVGYTRLLGDTAGDVPGAMTTEAGFKVAGWFELGLAAVEGVRLDGRMIVMATQEGFAVGGRGEARLGDREASHVAVGVEYLADVGTNGYFRLGWGTVPKLPMSATVEITNLPASYRDTGVRLYYDIAREVAPGLRVGLRVGYAARNQSVAGFTGGAGAAVEF